MFYKLDEKGERDYVEGNVFIDLDGTQHPTFAISNWDQEKLDAEGLFWDAGKAFEVRRENMPVLSRLQLSLVLRRSGIITADEAKAFAPGNALPAVAATAIANAPWPQDAKDDAEVRALGALTIRRDNPLVLLMQAAVNAEEPDRLTDEALDALWAQAAEID